MFDTLRETVIYLWTADAAVVTGRVETPKQQRRRDGGRKQHCEVERRFQQGVVLRADTHVDGGDDAGVEPDECERAGSDRRGQTGPVELRDRAVAGRRQDAAVILADAGRSGGRLPGAIVEQRVRIGVATGGRIGRRGRVTVGHRRPLHRAAAAIAFSSAIAGCLAGLVEIAVVGAEIVGLELDVLPFGAVFGHFTRGVEQRRLVGVADDDAVVPQHGAAVSAAASNRPDHPQMTRGRRPSDAPIVPTQSATFTFTPGGRAL
jgi:hypothetical protein